MQIKLLQFDAVKTALSYLIAVFALLAISPAKATTYYSYSVDFTLFNQQGLISTTIEMGTDSTMFTNVTGNIVTNCDNCTLGPSNIVSWSFNLGTFTNPFFTGPIIISSQPRSAIYVASGGSPLRAYPAYISISAMAFPPTPQGIAFEAPNDVVNLEFITQTDSISHYNYVLVEYYLSSSGDPLEHTVFGTSNYFGLLLASGIIGIITPLTSLTCDLNCLVNPVNLGNLGGGVPLDYQFPLDFVVTPLPAALPLFATGLGALGLLGWRRKRKVAALAAA